MIHVLDISAVLVLAGVFLGRRLRDPGAIALERTGDFLTLAGWLAVSVTGLALTASNAGISAWRRFARVGSDTLH